MQDIIFQWESFLKTFSGVIVYLLDNNKINNIPRYKTITLLG